MEFTKILNGICPKYEMEEIFYVYVCLRLYECYSDTQ